MYQVILLKNNYYYSYVESDDTTLGNIEVSDLPHYQDINKARSCYYDNGTWVYDENKYLEIKEEIARKEAETLANSLKAEKLEAQVLYTAMMTDTLLEGNEV